MKRIFFRCLLAILTVAKLLGSWIVSLGRVFSAPIFWLAKALYRFILLPLYRLGVQGRTYFKKIFAPAKNKLVYPLTAKPVIHVVVILMIFTVTAANLHASTLPPSTGESSVLFSLIGGEETELIEETANQSRGTTSLSYLGPAYGVSTAQVALTTTPAATGHDQIALLTTGGNAVALTPVLPGVDRSATRTRKIRTDVESYIVQSGDTISTIAGAFGLSQSTILWANNMGVRDYIKPGQELKILPVDGVIYKIKKGDTMSKLAKQYGVSEDSIREYNDLDEDAPLTVSQDLIIPGGKVIYVAPTVVVRAPIIDRIVDAITNTTPSPEAGKASMIWPTSGHVITQYWGWNHTGVDIDGHYDSPIYASDSGVVEIAGWGTGYGIQSVLNHENGYKSRYAHMSKIFVTPGQRVTKGEVIGMVGTTGRSTGTHLHFEIYVNGKRANPLLYVR